MNYYGLIIALAFLCALVFMFFKYRKYLALLVIISVLFLPKINIVSLSSASNAGLRTDDLVIAFFIIFTVIFEKFKTYDVAFNTKFYKIFTFYIISSVISFIVGINTGYTFSVSLSFFSLIRKIEYFSLIFVGYDLYYFHKDNTKNVVKKLLNIFVIFTAIISIFQVLQLLGSFRFGSFDAGSFLGRAVGTFNGPYELGAFFTITAIMYYYDLLKGTDKKWLNISFLIISFVLALFSKSRSPLLILILILAVMTMVYCKPKIKIVTLVASVCAGVLFLILLKFTKLSVLERFRSLNINELWNSLKYYFNNRSYSEYLRTLQENIVMEGYVIQTGDISFNIRIFKWMALLEIFMKFPLFGYGFGSNLVIDGNYTKMLAENGLVGLTLFLWVFKEISYEVKRIKNHDYIIWAIISVFLGSVLIDMFEASKIMEFLWFLIGIANIMPKPYKNLSTIRSRYDKNITYSIRP